MLDLKFIRDNVDAVRKAIDDKNIALDLDLLLRSDQQVRELKSQVEKLQAQRNTNAKATAKVPADQRAEHIAEGRRIAQAIEEIKPELKILEEQLQEYLYLVPNIPAGDVPVGPDETANVEIERFGQVPEFDFSALDHVEILEKHHWAEFSRIAQVSGSRSYALRNEMVLLELALQRFALDKLTAKGFNLISCPAVVREHALFGTGHFPTGMDQVYQLPEDNLYLSGTAEVQINSLHAGEILLEENLPLLYAGFSSCFRREAGSYGKDVRGLIRVHQFMKVEQYIICRNDEEESAHWHQQLLKTSQEILTELELPYRIIECCTGDMGAGKVKMYDLEAWVPSEQQYRETHSCSMLYDWQARRANLRYRDRNQKLQFCHTLNNTAVATPRILVPFLENHQLADGSVRVPAVLQPYLHGKDVLG